MSFRSIVSLVAALYVAVVAAYHFCGAMIYTCLASDSYHYSGVSMPSSLGLSSDTAGSNISG